MNTGKYDVFTQNEISKQVKIVTGITTNIKILRTSSGDEFNAVGLVYIQNGRQITTFICKLPNFLLFLHSSC